jgi:hypothetical protein
MARVLYTALMADMRGKLAGTVASKNKGGNILRTKVTPINPKSSYQSLQRAYLSDIAKAWSGTLTAAERIAWTNYGKSTNAKSVFGAALILSGIAAFQKVNLIVLTAGGTITATPPASDAVVSLTEFTATAVHTASVVTVTFTPTPLIATQGLYLWATPPLAPGIGNFQSKLRFLGWTSAAASPFVATTLYTGRFGALTGSLGKLVGFKGAVVDNVSGAISASSQTSAIVT